MNSFMCILNEYREINTSPHKFLILFCTLHLDYNILDLVGPLWTLCNLQEIKFPPEVGLNTTHEIQT